MEVAVIVGIILVPNLFDVGFDLLFRDLGVIVSVSSATLSVLFDALRVQTHAETLCLSFVENQLICQVVDDLERVSLQLFHVEVLMH